MAARKRKTVKGPGKKEIGLAATRSTETGEMQGIKNALRRQPIWMVLAVSSGACAAFNGVFAKLTTTTLTSSLASHIATLLSLSADNRFVEVAIRGFFFGMNLLFNAAMWALFTAALTRADSTTRVSIINVSANFFITAILGWMIFGEKLPPLWWAGASLLAAGNVVIGRREDGEKPGGTIGLDETREEAENILALPQGNGDLIELDDESASTKRAEESARIKKGEDADDPI